MKNLVLPLMIVSLCIGCCQTSNPPGDVSDAFMKKFDAAKDVKWDREEENEWEAEFLLDGKKMSACFDNSGTWLESEMEISKEEIPASIMDSIRFKFEGFEIEASFNIEKIDFTGYEVLLAKGDEKLEILINSDGEISGTKEVENQEDEDNEDMKENEEEGE